MSPGGNVPALPGDGGQVPVLPHRPVRASDTLLPMVEAAPSPASLSQHHRQNPVTVADSSGLLTFFAGKHGRVLATDEM